MNKICQIPTYLLLVLACLSLLLLSPTPLLAIPPDEPLTSPVFGVWLPEGVGLPKPVKPRVTLKTAPQGYNVCSCVSFARWKTGINVGSIGLAKHHPTNSQIPQVNAILVMRGGATGHLAVVTSVNAETIEIIEANNTPCKVTIRQLRKDDARISGYYIN